MNAPVPCARRRLKSSFCAWEAEGKKVLGLRRLGKRIVLVLEGTRRPDNVTTY